MTSDVQFTDAGFSFVNDGTRYDVTTKVGAGPALVDVKTTDARAEQAMEPEEQS